MPPDAIKTFTIPWLFQDIRTGKMTGTAVFTRNAEEKKIYFKDGNIVFASSNLNEDRLGEYLLRTGKLTREQFDKSSEIVIRTRKKLGAVLFEMGVLSAKDLVDQVKLQVKQIILTLFNWGDGRYQFNSGPLPVSEIIPLNMSAGDLILDGVRELAWKGVRESLPSLNTVLRPATNPSFLSQNAHLDRDQQEVFSLMNGDASIKELILRSGLGDLNTLKAIYALLALRMVDAADEKAETKEIVTETIREAAARVAKPMEQRLPTDASATREMILNAFESMARQNHYELLGVSRGDTPQEIKKAYLIEAKRFHPDRHFDPGMDNLKEKLDALYNRIHEAYETLSIQDARNQYNIDLASGVQAAEANKRTPDNDAALVQFKEGLKQFNAGNFWGAEEAFSRAARLDQGNAEYVFHRGLALSRIPRRGRDAEELYLAAISLSPSKANYYLELGNFYAKSGLKEKALSAYTSALTRDPDSEIIKQSVKNMGG